MLCYAALFVFTSFKQKKRKITSVNSVIYWKKLSAEIMCEKRSKTMPDRRLLAWHPEMVLVSKSPVMLEGFLIIPNLPSPTWKGLQVRVKLQIIAPNYPLLQNVQIKFGTAIAFLRNRNFNERVKKLMNSDTTTVPTFLTQLQSLIGKHLHYEHLCDEDHASYSSLSNLMEDLKAVLQNSSDVHVSCDDKLSTIKFSLNDVFLTLKRNENTETPWTVVSSNIPKTFKGFENNIKKLHVAITKFKWQVEMLDKAWEQLKEIDENCWVIDPSEPDKSHMHRRIHLSQSISVTIIIDPLNPTALPEIKFSGSDSEVKKQTDYVSANILNWNPNCSILENLRMLLNMYEFPEQQESLEDKNAIIGNRECGICFFAKSETDDLPDKICNNEKCMKHYHSSCLSRWLQTNAGNQVVFDHIHGTCPHCKEKISCSTKC